MTSSYPNNLTLLHEGEERLYKKSKEIISNNSRLLLHLEIIEMVMDMCDAFRQHDTKDENVGVIQLLGIRVFNAFASSLKLMLSGYYQNSALIMRDILETVFLIDLFSSHTELIEEWRTSGEERRKKFKAVAVREKLDKRDGFDGKKRAEMYTMLSELAGHPSMVGIAMLRPANGSITNCPFLDPKLLEESLAEMGRLALQVGEHLCLFFPKDWKRGIAPRLYFNDCKVRWCREFYSRSPKNNTG